MDVSRYLRLNAARELKVMKNPNLLPAWTTFKSIHTLRMNFHVRLTSGATVFQISAWSMFKRLGLVGRFAY